jgi:hypothetical protein
MIPVSCRIVGLRRFGGAAPAGALDVGTPVTEVAQLLLKFDLPANYRDSHKGQSRDNTKAFRGSNRDGLPFGRVYPRPRREFTNLTG